MVQTLMFTAEADSSRSLVKLTLAGHLEPEDYRPVIEQLTGILGRLDRGFRLLTDLSGVESMPVSVAPQVAQIMELCDRHGVETVVRILPVDPRNDVGFAILSRFHYRPDVRIVTCESLDEAMSFLAE